MEGAFVVRRSSSSGPRETQEGLKITRTTGRTEETRRSAPTNVPDAIKQDIGLETVLESSEDQVDHHLVLAVEETALADDTTDPLPDRDLLQSAEVVTTAEGQVLWGPEGVVLVLEASETGRGHKCWGKYVGEWA